MNKLTLAILGAAALCGAALASGSASAMPLAGVAAPETGITSGVQDVHWVCGPFRCWWRPNFYARPYPAWGYRVWGRPWWGRSFAYRGGWGRYGGWGHY